MNQTLIKTFILSSALSLLLVGCGGGGGGSTSSTSSAVTTPSNTIVAASIAPSNTGVSANVLPSGSLVVQDAGFVSGLRIECNNNEVTPATNGSFVCDAAPIAVYLGDFKIGEVREIPSDGFLYTQDLIGVSRGATSYPDVTKISMILQSLDDDAQPLNGITLKQDTLSLLSEHLSYSTKLNELSFDDVNNLIKDVIARRAEQDKNSRLKAVNSMTAQSNLTTAVAAAPAKSYTQRSLRRSL